MSTEISQEQSPQHLALTPEAATALIAERALALAAAHPRQRLAIGLAGGPGVGKSTIAVDAVAAINAHTPGLAAYVPMDGFHMKHKKLEALGTVRDKGMPHTFEGAAFAEFLAGLKRADHAVSGPGYSRQIEDTVDDAFTIAAPVRLLVVEGNYLLLDEAPWDAVPALLDLSFFIHVARDKVWARLMKRHAEAGLFTEERNREHIARVDLANYDRVEASAGRAAIRIDIVSDR
jgi:pantothenate kinase